MSEKIKAEISEISKKTRRTDAQIEKLQTSMEKLLDEAITESRHVEKETEAETVIDRILLELLDLWRQGKRYVSIKDFAKYSGLPYFSFVPKHLLFPA